MPHVQVHLRLPPLGIAFDESSGVVKDILAGMAKVFHVFLGWHCKGWICFQGILESREFDADQRTGRQGKELGVSESLFRAKRRVQYTERLHKRQKCCKGWMAVTS